MACFLPLFFGFSVLAVLLDNGFSSAGLKSIIPFAEVERQIRKDMNPR